MDADARLKNAARCREIIEEFVDRLSPLENVVVSGGAKGPDSVAVELAKERGIRTVVYKPDWSKGKGAGFARNTTIVLNSHDVMAFWDMESNGTLDTLKKARKYNRPFGIVGPDGMLVTMMDEELLEKLAVKKPKMATKFKRRR